MEKRTQLKVAMAYGAMCGLAGVIVSLIFYFANSDIQSKTPQWINYLLIITFIVIGIKSYRDQELGGSISYGTSLGTGTLIGLCAGFIMGFYTVVLFNVIDPGLAQKIIDTTQEQLADKGMSEDQIAMAMTWSKKFMSPIFLFFFSIIGSTFMSFIFSLFISVFMKKEQQNPFQSNSQVLDSGTPS